jgi:hypothetical protein
MAPLTEAQAAAFATNLALINQHARRAGFEPLAIAMGVLQSELNDEYHRVVALMTPPRWDLVFLQHPRPLFACSSEFRNSLLNF